MTRLYSHAALLTLFAAAAQTAFAADLTVTVDGIANQTNRSGKSKKLEFHDALNRVETLFAQNSKIYNS